MATLGDGHSFRLPIPTGKGEELEGGKWSGSSGTEDEDLTVVTDAADNVTGSKSPTPVANLGEVAGPRLPNSATFGKGEANIVCKYL